ncbi:MAG: GNAT family N-acetyltransferase [Gemmatimonadota bacterium]
MSVAVRLGAADDLPHVAELYREWGYRSAAHPSDTLIVAENDHRIVGALRLVVEDGHCVLRGMRVQPAYQRTGVGTRMLELAVKHIGARECFGIPYEHLLPFYAKVGFVEVPPADAPPFLAERSESYRVEGLKVAIIRRPPRPPLPPR